MPTQTCPPQIATRRSNVPANSVCRISSPISPRPFFPRSSRRFLSPLPQSSSIFLCLEIYLSIYLKIEAAHPAAPVCFPQKNRGPGFTLQKQRRKENMSKNIPNHERSRKTHTHETASSVLRAAHGHRESAVPLGEVKRGHLQIGRGISKATLSAQPSLEELYRAPFQWPAPTSRAKEGIVTLLYPFPSLTTLAKNMLGTLQRAADILLNGSIPWQITSHGGARQEKSDLRPFQLRPFEEEGGANP